MVRTKAREGLVGWAQALRGRWLASRRWLRETVVWAGSDPPPAWACSSSLIGVTTQVLDGDPSAWQDTDLQSFAASPSVPLPLGQLPPMDRYPGLDYSTCVIGPGGAAQALQADTVEMHGVYTVGEPRSLIVVGSVYSAASGPAASVRVAHWQDDTPMAEIDDFFMRLRAEREAYGRIALCLVEGCDGSFRTPAVIDHAWRLGVYPSYHASVAPVFGIAADPHGRVYRGDSPGLKAFLEARHAGGVFHPRDLVHGRND